MTSFKPSSSLKSLQPQTAKSITFATASKSNPTESLPSEQKWWLNKFNLGPSSLIPKKKSTSATSVTFQTPSAGSAIISHVAFAPNTIKGYPYQMAVVSGPRVALYGGTQTSSLSRSLTRPKPDKKEEQVPLFGEDDSSVKPDRTVSTGGQPAHYASYHHDGRLLAVGCEHGYIKICDAQSRATIRTFATHGNRGGYTIRSTGWLPEGGKNKQRMIWSAGDDAIVRIWNLSGDMGGTGDSTKPLTSMKGHGDAIRSCVYFSFRENKKGNYKCCLVSGSYDHTIRVWDVESLLSASNVENDDNDRCTSIMNHGAPVETLLMIQSSRDDLPIIVSAGGTVIKLWNPLLGECLSTIQTKHSKTITSLCLATIFRSENEDRDIDGGDYGIRNISRRLISAGLDGLIRIHAADALFHDEDSGKMNKKEKYHLQYLHGVKTSEPITALAMSPDNTRLVIGSSNGFVTVRQRAKYVPQGVKRKNRNEPRAGTYGYFMRGATAGADADDHIVILQKKKKLQKYDKLLQKFCYGDALDAALGSRDPRAVSKLTRKNFISDHL